MKIETDGIHHLTVRVNNLARSSGFYGDVLGFDVQKPADDLHYFEAGSTLIVLRPVLPGTPANDKVIDSRVGYDHVAFHVTQRPELDKLTSELQKAGVATAGVERDPVLDKDYVCFRDPDNTQWEFYHFP